MDKNKFLIHNRNLLYHENSNITMQHWKFTPYNRKSLLNESLISEVDCIFLSVVRYLQRRFQDFQIHPLLKSFDNTTEYNWPVERSLEKKYLLTCSICNYIPGVVSTKLPRGVPTVQDRI